MVFGTITDMADEATDTPRCWWSGLGTCIKERGHDGDHHLVLSPLDTAVLVAVGTGEAPADF